MSTAIFIRSYAKDFEWLSFCLRSIHKFATGFCEVIVAVPTQDLPKLMHLTAETLIGVHDDGSRGYLNQQESKMHADMHTQADYICHLDSDCCLTQPVTPKTFMRDGKPLWLMTPWKDCMESKKTWAHVMMKCLQECPEHEFMRRHGITIPRWAYGAFREHVQKLHGITLSQYIMNQPGNEYSEFNCIGFYLWLHHRDKISWHDTSVLGVPPSVMDQAWSWGGMTPEIKNQLTILTA